MVACRNPQLEEAEHYDASNGRDDFDPGPRNINHVPEPVASMQFDAADVFLLGDERFAEEKARRHLLIVSRSPHRHAD